MSSSPTPDEDHTVEQGLASSADPIANIDPKKFAEKDAATWTKVYRECGGPLYGFFMSRTKHHHDAAELVQTTFLRLWKSKTFDPSRGSVWPYVLRCAVNVINDYHSTLNRRKEVSEPGLLTANRADLIAHICADFRTPIPDKYAEALWDEVENTIATMPEALRTFSEAFWLTGAYELAGGADYELFGCASRDCYYQCKSRSLGKLEVALRQYLGNDNFLQRKPRKTCDES